MKNLNPSDRLVYINLLARSDLERNSTFDMSADDLAFYTGLHRNTVYDSKRRLKNAGYIDFTKNHVTVCKLEDNKGDIGVSKKGPHTPKEKNNSSHSSPSNWASARGKKLVLRITRPPVEWQ